MSFIASGLSQRVYKHALEAIENSEDDLLVGEMLVPQTSVSEDPMDLHATEVMGAREPSRCLR